MSKPVPASEPLLTLRELAEKKNVPYSTVHRLVSEGYLRAARLGSSSTWRAKESDFDQLVEQSMQKGTR